MQSDRLKTREEDQNFTFYCRIREFEVKEALKRMENGKAILITKTREIYITMQITEIKLMSHTMKLWERLMERRLRQLTHITKNQFGSMPERSTMEAIYLL